MAKTYDVSDIVEVAIDYNLQHLHTSLPARVVTYDAGVQKASVQPLIKYKDRDGLLEDLPLILGVPVVFPSDGRGIFTFPIKSGDIVVIHFFERSTEKWLRSDGKTTTDPDDFRMHHYSDAWAVPGLFTFPTAIGSHPTDTQWRFNVNTAQESSISMKPSGQIVIECAEKIIINAQDNLEVDVQGDSIINVAGETTLTSNGTTINSAVEINGNVEVIGTVTATVDVVGGGKSLKTHKHTGVQTGGGVSGPPQ